MEMISEHSRVESELKIDRVRLLNTLQELHQLLEEYAPSWYTERLHDESEAILRPFRKS